MVSNRENKTFQNPLPYISGLGCLFYGNTDRLALPIIHTCESAPEDTRTFRECEKASPVILF
jgi:hypothetical protein